jgi:hypothetical protein
LLLCAVLTYLPTYGSVEAEEEGTPLLPGHGQIITVSDTGIQPTKITLKKGDGIAFILNDTKDSLITVDLAYGKHTTHCASSNLKIGEDGVIRSKEPIPPKDFASTCFHDSGSYAFTVYGSKGSPNGIVGTIVVE